MNFINKPNSSIIKDNQNKLNTILSNIIIVLREQEIDYDVNDNMTEIKVPSSVSKDRIDKLVTNCTDISNEVLSIFLTIRKGKKYTYIRKRLK